MAKTPTIDIPQTTPTADVTPAPAVTQASITPSPRQLNLWAVYGICLLISAIFFFFFGYNSPRYEFNSDIDYQWYMTMGHGLVAGKIPYRDLFEQKGPIVFFVSAFCCLFKNPNIIMLLIETICMSLFFFFAYRICRKRLNTFYSLLAIPILALAIFTTWCRIHSGAAIEEFCLPIYAYFLLCWLEFLFEKRAWNWVRALCLGLCFGIILWSKFTLIYFMIAPMVIWLILNLREHQYRTIVTNLLLMLAGILLITLPIVIFYIIHHALDDLFRVYFLVNLTAYNTIPSLNILTDFWKLKAYIDLLLSNFGMFFTIGAFILFLIIWGVVRFTIRHWREITGWLVLIAFCVNLGLLVYFYKGVYYYGQLFPYAILGVLDLLDLISSKLILQHRQKLIFTVFTAICLVMCLPLFTSFREWNRSAPLVVADVIHNYENEHNTKATLFCYKILDYGFYNTVGVVPDDYYYAQNYLDEQRYPAMYVSFQNSIKQQSSDFVITELKTWNAEKDFLSQYYAPFTGDIITSTYYYHQAYMINFNQDLYFVLLFKI